MKRSNRLVIFVGVLLAILAFVGIVIVLNQNGGNGGNGANASPTTVAVLVAKQDIAIGDPVTADVVEVKQVDPGAQVGTPFRDPSQVGGRPALIAIAAGSQVSQEAVSGGGVVGINEQLQAGERAIAFQVDAVTGLNFLVKPGDHIDVIIGQKITVLQPTQDTVTKPADQQRFETVPGLEGVRTVKTVLQDKRVLYVSRTRSQTTTQPAASASPAASAQPNPATAAISNVIIIFAGTDQDAELIKFAQNDVNEIGALTVTLRNTDDTDVEQTTGITIDKLVTDYGVPLPNIVQKQLQPTP